MGTINACKVCGISEGNCLCLDAIKAGYPARKTQQQPEVRSGEWVEELEAALRHTQNALLLRGRWKVENYQLLRDVVMDVTKILATERSSSTDRSERPRE